MEDLRQKELFVYGCFFTIYYHVKMFFVVIVKETLDDLSARAKENPRLRCNLDLRNSADDQSQRMLNALEPGTVMPIHRHKSSSETCICIRGHFEEYFYDENGNLTETIDMVPGGVVLNIERGQWRSLKCLESGTVLFEAKDGAYHPLDEDEVMTPIGSTFYSRRDTSGLK